MKVIVIPRTYYQPKAWNKKEAFKEIKRRDNKQMGETEWLKTSLREKTSEKRMKKEKRKPNPIY